MKPRHIQSLILAAVCLLSANLLSAQATDYYLKIEGSNIPGSSQANGHKDEIIVLSYAFSVSNGAQVTGSQGIVSANSQTDGVEFLIQGDVKAIPLLFKAVNNKDIFEKMTLTAVAAFGGRNPYNPIILTLEDCMIASLEQEGAQGDLPIFSITVVPTTVKIKTQILKYDGSIENIPEQTWNYSTDNSTGSI